MKTLLKVFAAGLLVITGAWTANAQSKFQDRALSYADKSTVAESDLGKSFDITGIGGTAALEQAKKATTGVVVDKAGVPLIGATVLVKGTTNGTTTDLDGKFSINAPEGAVLEVMSIGYKTVSITAAPGAEVKVVLEDDAMLLEEVVVVGYGTTKKVNLTGAVDQVTSEAFENRPVANASQMLMGAVPNLNISLADGKPNRSASYNVRGTTSIGAGGSALILIDGIEGDPAMLNPNDIESVTVLKDAASSAIYGSRAPYGVDIIYFMKI